MAQLDKYRYSLKKLTAPSTYEYYYVDGSGAVATQVGASYLGFTPDGWDGMELQWVRGFEYFGVFTNITNSLRFVKDGGTILRDIYYKQGINGNCQLYIEMLDSDGMTYSLFYKGELDFSTFKDETPYSTINVLDGTYMEQLKARETTNYELDIDSHSDYFYVKMDGIRLKAQLNYITIDERDPFPTNMYDDLNFRQALVPTIGFSSADSAEIVGIGTNQATAFREWFSSSALIAKPREDYFFEATRACDFDLVLNFRVALRNQGTGVGTQDPIKLEVRMLQYWKNSFPGNGTVIMTTPSFQANNGSTSIWSVNLTHSGSLVEGERIGLLFNVITASGVITNKSWEYDIGVEDGTVRLDLETIIEETYVKALHPKKVFDFLVDEISESTVSKNAGPLVTNQNYAVTSFDAIRGLTGAKIKTNFKDFFETYNAILSLGSYYDEQSNTHRIEYKSDLFDDSTNIYTIDECSNMKVYPLTEELANTLFVGYPEIEIEGLNAKEAFNNRFEFTTPVTRTQDKKDLTSIYIADPFTVELTRANMSGKTSTSNDFDNKNCLLHTNLAPTGTYLGKDYYELYRDGSMTITGLSYPDEMYNIDLSPKRNLERLGAYIHSILHLVDAEYIKFVSSDRNQTLSTTSGATTIDEDADVLISSLLPALFLPVIFEIECPNPVNIQTLLYSNPYGYIDFEWEGNTYEGFILESKDDPTNNAPQVLKLIATTNNTLTNLI